MDSRDRYNWYVYELVDPRNNKPFYIGKGSGDRSSQHIRDAKKGRGNNLEKESVIMQIIDDGLEVVIRHTAYFFCEAAAYSHEAALIKSTPNLTNWSKGTERPKVLSLFATIRSIAAGKGDPLEHRAILEWFKPKAELNEHKQLIDAFLKALCNQSYVDKVYG